jgi:5-methylcytosine-specific restriction endonuclease McrA
MGRRRFTDKDRARIFADNNGVCHLCNQKIDGIREAWEIEHVIAWELTRDDSDENLRPAHIECHKQKTHQHDRPVINEAKRREAKHTGVKRPSSSLATRDKRAPKRLTKQLPPRVRDVFGRPAEKEART